MRHGRHGSTGGAARRLPPGSKHFHTVKFYRVTLHPAKLHRVELWGLRAGPKFSAGRGDMFPNCIRARDEKLLPIRSRNPSVIYALLHGASEFRDPGGIPTKTAFARGGMESRFHSVDMVHKRISANSIVNFIK